METLGNPKERNLYSVENTLDYFLEDAVCLAKKHDISIETVIQAKHALELERQNNIAVQHGEHTDEQATNLKNILDRIATALEERV